MLSVGFGLKNLKSMKYCILFEHRDVSMYVTVAKGLSLVQAVQFAINLHGSSNTEHVITVCRQEDKGNVSILELSKPEI